MSFSVPAQEALAVASDRKSIVDGSKGSALRYDPLADIVVRRWFDAWQYRQSETIGPCSIEQTLQNCYMQRMGVYPADELALLDGINVFVPLTDMKCMAAEAWLRDMLAGVMDMPFTIDPTPIPDLPARMRMKVLRDLKIEIAQAATAGNALAAAQRLDELPPELSGIAFGQMIADYPGDLENLAGQMKEAALRLAFAEAKQATDKMGTLIRDQLIQMNFARVMQDLFHDIVTYPAAILKGPLDIEKPRIHWSGNRRVQAMKKALECYRVSPFDFMPSADSPDTQRGTFVIEKTRMTRRVLAWAREQKFYIKENIDRILDEYRTWQRNWLLWDSASRNLEQPQASQVLWGDEETVDTLEHHGIFSGRELRQYGFSAEERSFYEAKVCVIGGRTICVKVNGEAHMAARPYMNTSYERMGEQFYNTCPVMKLRDVQRTVNSAVRAQIRNMAYSSGPIAEIDVSRVQRYVTNLTELLRVEPYSALLTDPDMMNGGRPARQFQNVPQIIGPLQQTIAFYMKMADDVSNIPAYAQGDTGLSGAGRTYRGFSAVFAQALKVFKMPVQNLDMDVFGPLASAMYNHNMTVSTDDSIKGDALVRARGSQGLVDLEQQQQKALEAMQVVTQMSPAVAQIAPQEARQVLRYTWAKAMEALGIPLRAFGIDPEVEAALGYSNDVQQDPGSATPIPPVNAETPPPG
jgi:hypothetical protein